MAYSGRFTPRNPSKYVGDSTNIIYRSSWECRLMDWFDRNPDIVSWASEELIIPYKSPVDNKFHQGCSSSPAGWCFPERNDGKRQED